MVESNWAKPHVHRRPQGVSLAESQKFKLSDFDLDRADEMDLWAALIESAALCTRLARRRLQQVRPLGRITDLIPPMSKNSIGDLSDFEAKELVDQLRRTAEEIRAQQGTHWAEVQA